MESISYQGKGMCIKAHFIRVSISDSFENRRAWGSHLPEISPRKKHVEMPITTLNRVDRERHKGMIGTDSPRLSYTQPLGLKYPGPERR